MNLSLRAIGCCLSFYSGVYMIYSYFALQHQPIFLLCGILLIGLSWLLIPSHNHRRRGAFNDTFAFETFFSEPLYFWWRLFSWPARALIGLLRDD